jgi:MFS family permease
MHPALRECPWIVATILSATAILGSIPVLNHPWGSNWPMYFEAAHYFWDPTAAYFGWRPPLYPLLLATVGAKMGYVAGAHLIAQISMVIVVVGTGIFARLMTGVWPAVLAVLSIPLLQCAVEGAMWTNMYPPAAAAFALAAAASAAVWRVPTLGLALATGILAGLAWQINHLGLVAIPMGLGMTLVGASKVNTRALWLGLPLMFGLGAGAVYQANGFVVEHWNVPQEDLPTQVLQRRSEELDRLRTGHADRSQYSACTDLTPKQLNLTELTNGCGQQFVRANYGTLTAEDCAPSWPTLLWLLPLTLLPSVTRRSWTDTAASVLVFGGPLGAFLVAAAWTSYAEKYAISFLPMMVLIVPMAFTRLGGWLGHAFGRVTAGQFIGLIGAAVWTIYGWPGTTSFQADPPNINTDWESVSGEVATWASKELRAEDILIDCVPLNIDLVLLPVQLATLEGVSTEHECMEWVKTPPASAGQIWMVQQAFAGLPETGEAHMRLYGWRLIRQYDDRHRLWVHQP